MRTFKDFFYQHHEFGRFGLTSDAKQQQILEEGLITSYPFSDVVAMLKKKYGDMITHIQSDLTMENEKTAGISVFFKMETVNQEFIAELEKNLKVYGYFIAFNENDGEEVGFFIEPKFPFVIDHKTLKGKRCFHLTHVKYLLKIQKIGLVPKNSQTHFSFDGSRIYLMFSNSPTYIKLFKQTLAKSKDWNISDLALLEITNFDGLKLYFDMNFGDIKNNIAAFTFDNIYPDNIKVLE